MNPTAVFSKSGKGVQEASGKTSILSRADRAVLAAFDGRMTLAEVAEKVGKALDPKFTQLVEQLEKDNFVRQVTAGADPMPTRPAPAARPPSKPGAKPAGQPEAGEELDFTIFSAPKAPKPAAPPVDLAAKSREEAERKAKEEQATSYKARQEIERARLEAEARAKAAAQARLQAESAAKARAEAEAKGKADAEAAARAKAAEAEAKVRAEADAKVKAAREAAVRAAADAKARAEADLQARLEAERAKAREEAERIRKEAEDKARREAEELRQRLEEERKAREEAEAARREAEEKAREEAERVRREAEEKARREAEEKARREAEELRMRLEEERKAREAAEAARKKAEEQAREEERRRREEDERRAREEAERRAREEEERAERDRREKQRAEEERERAERDKAQREKAEKERIEERERAERDRAERERSEREKAPEPVAAAPAGGGFSDSLLADLDSFGQREEEEKKAQEEAEAKRKKAEQQARAEAERRAREEEERAEKQEAERKARKEAERKAKEEAERAAEAEARAAEERQAEERKRKARETVAAKAAAEEDDDIGVTDEDLDMDEVKRDQKALSQEARRAAREREREQEKEARQRAGGSREDAEEATAPPAAPARVRRPIKWGKPVAVGLFALLIAAVGAVHVMPISTADYEKAASDALGVPVKIGSARVSLFTGVQLKLDKVTVGPASIEGVRAFPALGSLFGEKKTFSRIELDGVTLPQQAIGAALLANTRGSNFEVAQIVAQKVKLEGPLVLPVVDADLTVGADGRIAGGSLRGPDNLMAKLEPKGSEIEVELNAGSFALPVAPEITLNQFGMKAVAGRDGMEIPTWSATLYDGVLSGNARLAWGGTFSLEGVVTVRGMNVAVFAPALLSEGKAEGTGRFSMAGADAGKLAGAARLEGNFNITKGVLGSIDISRAISTGGRQASGRTPFTEMVGQGVYDRGAVQLRNVTIGAGALNAGASADIAQGGALSGRIVADVRAASQTLRATLNLGGTVKEPQVRN